MRIFKAFWCLKIMESKIQNESYTNNYQKHVACSYGYKLVCVDDKLSKPFKSYLRKEAVYNFITSMIEESKCCSDVMKKNFTKNLKCLKKIMKILGTPLIVRSVIMPMLMAMLK